MRHAPSMPLGSRYSNLLGFVRHKTVGGGGIFSWLYGCFCLLSMVLLPFGGLAFASSYELDMQRAAYEGDPSSQYGLALLLEFGGEQVRKDPQQALLWFEKAAGAGVAGACFYLGIKYEYGNRVPRNLSKAACLYSCAARQDWPAAQYFIGRMYERGKGVEQSTTLALAWYQLAAQWQYPEASADFSRLYSSGVLNDIASLGKIQRKLLEEAVTPCH